MDRINNFAEKFYREIRYIDIFDAADLPYMKNFKGEFPTSEPKIRIDIVPETFSRKILPKKAGGNYYTDIDLGFPLLDLRKVTRDYCNHTFNKKAFAVVLVSNTEKIMLGNDREPLTIDFIDNIADNNSGNDECNFSITGSTIIIPKIQE